MCQASVKILTNVSLGSYISMKFCFHFFTRDNFVRISIKQLLEQVCFNPFLRPFIIAAVYITCLSVLLIYDIYGKYVYSQSIDYRYKYTSADIDSSRL